MDFSERMKLRGKAEEDLYFAKRDKALIDAIHDMAAEGRIKQWHENVDKDDDRPPRT
ncbi:hypothetical protein L4C36_16725 [Photobacterium japonica]|uniref:hypothetical protein n=1 Tax=Photobacterium japonica TaxID=2910235 RepID=UPI003D0DFC01